VFTSVHVHDVHSSLFSLIVLFVVFTMFIMFTAGVAICCSCSSSSCILFHIVLLVFDFHCYSMSWLLSSFAFIEFRFRRCSMSCDTTVVYFSVSKFSKREYGTVSHCEKVPQCLWVNLNVSCDLSVMNLESFMIHYISWLFCFHFIANSQQFADSNALSAMLLDILRSISRHVHTDNLMFSLHVVYVKDR